VNLVDALDFSLDRNKSKGFDDMLESAKIDELRNLLEEKKYLIEPD